MLFSLLLDTTSTTEESGSSSGSNVLTIVFLVVIVVALIAMIVINSRRNKKRQQEAENLINAVGPGNKVKTIGGICGIVVEVDNEENTFILETGSESTGKMYIKFDKQAIYQTDAVATPANDEKSAPETTEEVQANADEVFDETATEEKTPEAAEDSSKEQD